jgi:hypothetical protein
MIVYKRVDERTQPGKILSAGIEGKHETEYVPGEWKHLSNIFVFDTQENADYCGFGNHTWECETPETHPAPSYILLSWDITDELFEAFWADPQGYTRDNIEITPAGTLLCNELLLIKRVEEVE